MNNIGSDWAVERRERRDYRDHWRNDDGWTTNSHWNGSHVETDAVVARLQTVMSRERDEERSRLRREVDGLVESERRHQECSAWVVEEMHRGMAKTDCLYTSAH